MFLGEKYSRGIYCGSWALELFTYNINIIETNIIINAVLYLCCMRWARSIISVVSIIV